MWDARNQQQEEMLTALHRWDHAGGVLIFEEAGGKVTDLDGKAIDFSKGRKMSDSE